MTTAAENWGDKPDANEWGDTPEAASPSTGQYARLVPASIAKAGADAISGTMELAKRLSPQGIAATVAEALTGERAPASALESAGAEYVRELGADAAGAYGVEAATQQTLPGKVIAGAASLVPAIASGPAAPVTMAGMMGESVAQEADAYNATPMQKEVARMGGAAVGVLAEATAGATALLRSVVKEAVAKPIGKAVATQAVKGLVREGTQEAGEQAAQNLIASDIAGYDPTRPITKGVGEAALIGGLVGTGAGTVLQAAASLDARTSPINAKIDNALSEVASATPPPLPQPAESGGDNLAPSISPEPAPLASASEPMGAAGAVPAISESKSEGPGAAAASEELATYDQHRFGNRVVEDERVPQNVKDAISRYYPVIPNKVTASEAKDFVDNVGEEAAIAAVGDSQSPLPFRVRVTIGEGLALRMAERVNTLAETDGAAANAESERMISLIDTLDQLGMELGQGVQSFAMWSRLSPTYALKRYQKAVNATRATRRTTTATDDDAVIAAIKAEPTKAEKAVEQLAKKGNKTAKKIRNKKSVLKKLEEAAKDGKLTDAQLYEVAAKELGLPEYSPETATKILDLARDAQGAKEGLPQDRAMRKLNDYIAQLSGFSPTDFGLGYFYGNILSGAGTQVVNTADTGLNVISEVSALALSQEGSAKERAGRMAEILEGLAKGVAISSPDAWLAIKEGRRISVGGIAAETPGLFESARFGTAGGVPIKGAGRGAQALKTVLESKPATVLNAWKYVGRLMQASDAVMYRGASEAKAMADAIGIASKEGLSGNQRRERVDAILGWDKYDDFLAQAKAEGFTPTESIARATELMIQSRPEALRADANEFAVEATYNGKPRGLLGKISNAVSLVGHEYPATRLVVPFTKIVANVFNRKLDYIPGVALWRAREGQRNEFYSSPEQKKLGIIRGNIGALSAVVIFSLAEAGVLELYGGGPSDDDKRKQLRETGWKPNSIKIGDKYFNYANTPIGLLLGIIGNVMDWRRYEKDSTKTSERDVMDTAGFALQALVSYMASQSFLSGVQSFMAGLTKGTMGEATFKKFVANTAAGVTVPMVGLMRDIDALFDDTLRSAKSMKEAFLAATPFARYANRPVLNAFGEEIHTGRIRPLTRFVSNARNDKAWNTVAELGLRVPVPDPWFRTVEENFTYQKESGKRLKRWVLENEKTLRGLPTEEAQEMLQNAGTDLRKQTRNEMLSDGAKKKGK